MDWENERYVRLYVRDTATWLMLPWQSRLLLPAVLRKLDRAGILDIGDDGYAAVSAVVGVPLDFVQQFLPPLIDKGVFILRNGRLIMPKYIEAQESVSTTASRQRESRARRRDLIARGLEPGERQCAIYFIQSEDGGPIKVGRAEDVAHRLVQMQTSRPDKLVLLASCQGTYDDELRIQKHFAELRVKGEWFAASEPIKKLISHVIRDKAIPSDLSQFVTSHSVPSLAEPSLAEPNQETLSARDPSGTTTEHEEDAQGSKGWHWLEAFKPAHVRAHNGTHYGRGEQDAKACAKLSDLLAEIPEGERAETWRRRSAIIAEFLTDGSLRLVNVGHSFAFFVEAFSALRIPRENRPKVEAKQTTRPPVKWASPQVR